MPGLDISKQPMKKQTRVKSKDLKRKKEPFNLQIPFCYCQLPYCTSHASFTVSGSFIRSAIRR